MNYRGFTITILRGVPHSHPHYYRITGNGLPRAIQTDAGETTEQRAIDEAKEFIDEHLVGEGEVAP